jgi:hypothetical protein
MADREQRGLSDRLDLLCRQILLALLIGVTGCATPQPRAQWPLGNAAKITFRLDDIRPDGLRGRPGGLVSVSYEFCIPADDRAYQEVRRIDPSVRIHRDSPGRIGCSSDQALCIGETHQPRWRDVLRELTSLPYVVEIRECHFE